MNMSINSAAASSIGSVSTPHMTPERQAFRQLSQSLKSGDLDGAKQAYDAMVKNAPAGATWNANSQFAQLGKAIQSGDIGAAQSAFASMVHARMNPPTEPPAPVPTPVGAPGGPLVDLTA